MKLKSLLLFILVPTVLFIVGVLHIATQSDYSLVHNLRTFYPGGAFFSVYEKLLISRGEEIVPELIEASFDSDPKMRESAARVLGRIGGPLAVKRLINMAGDPEIKYYVWVSIGFAADRSAIPVLEELLRNETSESNRERLTLTLVRCGDHSLLDDLKDIVENSEFPGHVYNASELIRSISKANEGASQKKGLKKGRGTEKGGLKKGD